MPTYEYACQACDHSFEEFQSITARPLRKCPKCARPKLRRLIGTGGGVIFKGSGFYQTDYRSESYKQAAEAETKSSSGDGKGDSGAKGGAKKDTATRPDKTAAAKSEPKSKPSRPDKGSGK